MLEYNRAVPILFIVFNRPSTTERVFEAIKKAKPKTLYIAADGPRNQLDKEKVAEVRRIVAEVDWPCEVRTKFSSENLGCRVAVSSAINWFFENELMGIILEDDCLPSASFFGFCSKLLEKYEFDELVSHIAGSNFQDGIKRGNSTYYFSRLTHVWGWASWRRVWKNYDVNLRGFKRSNFAAKLKKIPSFKPFWQIWLNNLQSVKNGEVDTWDYQYAYLNIHKGALSIIPNENLIVNIGFGEDATHTNAAHTLNVTEYADINDITYAEEMVANTEADLYTQNKEFSYLPPKKSVLSRIWKAIKQMFKK